MDQFVPNIILAQNRPTCSVYGLFSVALLALFVCFSFGHQSWGFLFFPRYASLKIWLFFPLLRQKSLWTTHCTVIILWLSYILNRLHCTHTVNKSIRVLASWPQENIQESGMNFRMLRVSLHWNTELTPLWRSPSRESKNSLKKKKKKKRLMLARRGKLLDDVDAPRELHE